MKEYSEGKQKVIRDVAGDFALPAGHIVYSRPDHTKVTLVGDSAQHVITIYYNRRFASLSKLVVDSVHVDADGRVIVTYSPVAELSPPTADLVDWLGAQIASDEERTSTPDPSVHEVNAQPWPYQDPES